MGLVDSALHIGRSALQTYQSALQVVGNNVANAGNADFTRQTTSMAALPGALIAGGLQPGAGVALVELKRNLDEALENRLRAAIGQQQSTAARQEALSSIEPLFDDVAGAGLSDRLTEFFNSWSDLQNHPEDLAFRDLVISTGTQLGAALGYMREQLARIGSDLDFRIVELAGNADDLAFKIAELNRQIATAGGGVGDRGDGSTHALEDQRDAQLRELSEILDVTVRAQPDGSIYVYAGSEPLVMGGVSRGLTTGTDLVGEFERTTVRFADTGGAVPLGGGRLGGLIAARDEQAFGRISALDEFAAALIHEVNQIHTQGQGLPPSGGFESATGTYAVRNTTAALNTADAGLLFAPRDGSFFIAVTDETTGTTVATRIDIDLDGAGGDDTTLESLAADINDRVAGITAGVTGDGRLTLQADAGSRFSFGYDGLEARDDTSGVLAALGINTFFNGSNAADFAVNNVVQASPALIAAARVALPGDGSNAGRLAQVASTSSEKLGGLTISEGYQRLASEVAREGAAAAADAETADGVLSALQAHKESISGVNLDEEAIEMLKFERAFQGAARYVATVDRLLNEMMALVG